MEDELRVKIAPAEPAGDEAALYVVGIGASAGGLDALRAFFKEIPAAPGVAFVVVVHLSPEHESHLRELLQQWTHMRVSQVNETVALEPNRVYVIPPNANLSAIDTHLRLSKLEARRNERAPIDHFLRTLATAHGGRAVGVILTGGGSDGALGLRRVRELGGLAIAQDPAEAQNGSMPGSAIATGMVDLVLPLREIGPAIQRFCATRPELTVPAADDATANSQRATLDVLLEHLRDQTGQDFSVYRRATMVPRVGRRMQLHQIVSLSAYLELLRNRPDEVRALCGDLLITAMEFFGEPELFDALGQTVLPKIFDAKPSDDDRVRVWSIGCSTGEEAYSLAILLLEETQRRDVQTKLQVFATDLAEDLLTRARKGVFPHEIAVALSRARLARFFQEEAGQYRVRREVSDIVVFATQNLFRDPPYSRLDLIVCRNLLADLQPDVRRGVLNLLHYALEPHGMLVVGPKDAIADSPLFERLHAASGIYRRRPGSGKRVVASALFAPFGRADEIAAAIRAQGGADDELSALHARFVERLLPPSVLVGDNNDVIHYSTGPNPYIRFPGGDPTHNVVKLVREPLRSPLRSTLRRARQDGQACQSDAFYVGTDHGVRRVVLRVDPVQAADRPGLLLVSFDEQRGAPAEVTPRPARQIAAVEAIARLEEDLERANHRIRTLLDSDAERSHLSSHNENLQSANEELRFILEELESSKQEVQAANEELITLDAENRRKIQELAELSGDLKHLLESTGIATLFLDLELHIVRFTPQLGELFNLTHLDRGRPLSDLTHLLAYNDLASDLTRVMTELVPIDREVTGENGRWYLTRLIPYRTAAEDVDGVVVTLIDITDRKRVEEKLRETDRRKDEFLALLAHELRNPLAPITTGIEILNRAGSDPRTVAQVTATMARQSKTLVRLVDDLLEVSRISGGRLRLNRAPTKLADVVRDAVAAVRPLVERAGHELTITVPDEPIVLDADATRLSQVFGNLLNNAARYTPKRGRIDLTAARDGDQAVVVVADTGVGIPDDIRGHVFEMFFQGNDPRLVRNAGLGIGLTLAKSLVEMHGGTIAVASPGVDGGSVFTVRLPIAATAELPAPARDTGNGAALGGHRVLIVDDNADAAETMKMLLKTFGDNDVRTVSSGPDALAVSADMRPDIVLLDLKMPGMDGYEVARRLRAQPGGTDLTIVAVTGWGQDEHKRRTREAGFDRHLTKPADRAELEAVLAASAKAKDFPAGYAG